jgi:hypothetical protein
VAKFCELCNEPSVSTKRGEFLDKASKYNFSKKKNIRTRESVFMSVLLPVSFNSFTYMF